MTSREAFFILNLLSGIGPVRVKQLLQIYGRPEEILRARQSSLAKIRGIGGKCARLLANWPDHVDLDGELALAERAGVTMLAFDDPDYPYLLKEIHDPPLCLYVYGDVPALDESCRRGLAIVGSRHSTRYGSVATEALAAAAVKTGWLIVSGLARGIDTAAHEAALQHQGRTIAVVAGGLGSIYPAENVELARAIREQGAIVSEQPMMMKPDRRSFPMRNRIIAGLALGVVVVEAGQKSGAIITAQQALEQGRLVFAVPGRIDSPMSRGCHSLIKQGAKLIESIDDIMSEFTYLPGFEAAETGAALEAQPQLELALSKKESSILELLQAGEMGIDEMVGELQETVSSVLATLFSMELRRLVRQLPGKRFELYQ